MKKLISLLALMAVGARAATYPTDFGSVPNAQARANVTNIAAIPLALQSGTSLDWSGGAHEKRLFREITTDTTFTFANLPTSATQSVTLVLYLTNNGPAGVASVTFPATVQWPGTFGAPTILQLSNSVTRYEFEHMGGGRVFGYDRSRFTVLAAGAGISLSSVASTTTVTATGSVLPATDPAVFSTNAAGTKLYVRNSPSFTNIFAYGDAGGGNALTIKSDLTTPTLRFDATGASDTEILRYNFPSSTGWQYQHQQNYLYLATIAQSKVAYSLYNVNGDTTMALGKKSTLTPIATLEIVGTNSDGNYLVINTNTFVVRTNGNVGIGTATPAAKLDVIGGISATNVSTTNGVYFRTNAFTAAVIEGGMNNGDFWQGNISNMLQVAYKTNNAVLWKPAVTF